MVSLVLACIKTSAINPERAPAVAALNYFEKVFSLNDTFTAEINAKADKCGYTDFLNKALTYPPPKDFPTAPDPSKDGCDVWDEVVKAATYINPCFNIYHLTDFCPFLWDEMGFPSLAGGPNNYFNQTAVQKALHVPPTNYEVCANGVFPYGDGSAPSALGPLPSVIDRTQNVIIGHGWFDYLLFLNGSLVTIQNMTWGGQQGFQKPPTEPLFVPYTSALDADANGRASAPYTADAGAGILGTAHTERGLTFSSVFGSGHGKINFGIFTRRQSLTSFQRSPNMCPGPHTGNWNFYLDGSKASKKRDPSLRIRRETNIGKALTINTIESTLAIEAKKYITLREWNCTSKTSSMLCTLSPNPLQGPT